MKKSLVGLGAMGLGAMAVAVVVGCTEPNPRSCADGTCTDPALPFCDVDGAFSGTAGTCVAVACTPGEHVSCRGALAIRCNGTGNDYDLVECASGCDDARGCIGCAVDDHCANPAPVCDQGASTCRGCQRDDECASQVCDLDGGACVLESSVVYASPAGSASSDCTQAEPCTLARAVMIASASGLSRTLRLLPGSYTEQLLVQGNVIVKAVATGAELGSASRLQVLGGARLDLRGIAIRSDAASGGMPSVCGDQGTTIPRSTLTLRDSILAAMLPGAMMVSYRCNLRIEQSEIGAMALNTDAIFEGDQLYVRGSLNRGYSTHSGERVSARVTNSVIENMYFSFSTSDSVAPGSQGFYAFNSFVFTATDLYQPCDASPTYLRDLRFENNVFFAAPTTGLPFVVQAAGCTFSNNVMFPQNTPVVNNVVADPLFVDLAGKDYHLQAGSPAVDTAVPSTGLSTTHDHDGVARPQGAAYDVGAFERLP